MDKELTPLEALSNLFKYACNYKVDKNHRLGNSKKWKDIVKNSLKALEAIKEEFLNRGDFIFRFEYTSDAMLVIEQWIMDNKINEIKIPFNRNYYDLLKEELL